MLQFKCGVPALASFGCGFAALGNPCSETWNAAQVNAPRIIVARFSYEESYLEGNTIVDAGQLVRNHDPDKTTVTFNSNILPAARDGLGSGNTPIKSQSMIGATEDSKGASAIQFGGKGSL